MESLTKLWLVLLNTYCRLLYPLYKQVTIGSIDLYIHHPDLMPPLSSSENLVFGDLRGKAILDLGTGCGIVALVAKSRGAASVLGVDINPTAIASANQNLERNFSEPHNIAFRLSNLYETVSGNFDIIVCNPPYFKVAPKGSRDFRYCGDLLERLLSDAKTFLRSSGEIRILHPASSEVEMAALAKQYAYELEVKDHISNKDNRYLRLLLGQTLRPKLKIYVLTRL